MTEDGYKVELIEQIIDLCGKTLNGAGPMLSREWLQLDLTMPQLKALSIIYSKGPLSMSDIAADLEVSLAAVTGVVDRLVERGVVLRKSKPDDRRVVLCALSEKGQDLVDGLWGGVQLHKRQWLEVLDLHQLQAFLLALQVILQTESEVKEFIQKTEINELRKMVNSPTSSLK